MKNNLGEIRREYLQKTLSKDDVDDNPVKQFNSWFDEAGECEVEDLTAMTLATSGRDGRISARTVLLKNVEEEGFTFFTNYESRKGKELEENPKAAVVFYWREMERQVRIEGKVQKTSEEESDIYFKSRPRGSKLSAAISAQSGEVPDRNFLMKLRNDLETELKGKEIPRPTNWGGYTIIPERFEFWQGRENRLHDRIEYRYEDGKWKIRRLAP